jgi:MerR family copper efflux transcriptional regulator
MSMPSEHPISCSLDARGLTQRLAEMSAIGEAGLLGARLDRGHAVLRFRASVQERLARVVAAEAECCPFLDMKLTESSGVLRLTIAAPDGAEAVLRDLVAAFDPADA